MTEETQRRLLRVLALVPKDSQLDPVWEPRAPLGVIYGAATAGLDETQSAEDLALLADLGYLERIFVERIMTCPTCGNHAVNVHESCVTCGSSNLTSITSYFHFRCGYIGPEKAFGVEPGGLRCPKCKRLLTDRGTNWDSPGEYFECRNCAAMFQQPQMGVRCLSCGAHFIGTGLDELRYRDIFAYRRALRGDAALSSGTLEKTDLVET